MDTETVTVLTAGTSTDPYSTENAEDWTTPTERTVTLLCPAEPRPSDEPLQDARNALTRGWTLYLPHSDPITRTDRVRVRGDVYPVQGVGADWYDGGLGGVVVQAFGTVG